MHIHVERGSAYAKFWLHLVSLTRNLGFRSHELTELRKLIEENAGDIQEKWDEHFND